MIEDILKTSSVKGGTCYCNAEFTQDDYDYGKTSVGWAFKEKKLAMCWTYQGYSEKIIYKGMIYYFSGDPLEGVSKNDCMGVACYKRGCNTWWWPGDGGGNC